MPVNGDSAVSGVKVTAHNDTNMPVLNVAKSTMVNDTS